MGTAKANDRDPTSDLEVLIDRIKGTGSDDERKIVFLVGTPMSLKEKDGVPDSGQIAEKISQLLGSRAPKTAGAESERYQQAFAELLRVRGPDRARQLLRDEVLQAYDREDYKVPDCDNDEEFAEIEADELGWKVPRGTRALGRIIAEFPDRFHDLVLTTNFDPLITIALRLAHCPTTQTLLAGDGNPAQTLVKGCHVVHLHGYWYRRDALHTSTQLRQTRPMLKAYLKDLMKKYTIVVVAYGGWDDLFTTAIREVSIEQNAEPDILWTFFSRPGAGNETRDRIRDLVPEAYSQGRVQFYSGIDCHQLFPELLDKLRSASTELSVRPRKERKPPAPGSRANTARMRGIVEDIRWTWSHEADAVQFARPRQIEWYTTSRSIIIEEIATRADWKLDPTHTPVHLCLFGAITGGRQVATLFSETVESPASAGEASSRARIEIPWRDDSEDLIFSCRIQPMGTRSLPGIAVVLNPPRPNLREPDPSERSAMPCSPHLTAEQALKGVWLKISAAGGIFVVKLHADFNLTEHLVYEPRDTWGGSWALGTDRLVLDFGAWDLETRQARERIGAGITLDDWGIFAATERHRGSLERTPFLVVHVPPPEKLTGASTASHGQ